MPFFFVFVGVLLIVTGAKDTYVALGKQVAADFTGDKNFFVWIMALGSIGAIGYVPKLKGFSNVFMALVLVAMVLSNSRRADILTLISEGLNNPETPPRPTSTTPGSTAPRSGLGDGSGTPATTVPDGSGKPLDKAESTLKKGTDLLGTAMKLMAIFGL